MLSLASLILVVIVTYKSFKRMERFEDKIPQFSDFLKKSDDGSWMLEERLAAVIDCVGSRMAHSLRQAAFQAMGVDAKLSKGVDKAIGLDMLNGSGIGGILDLLGMSETKAMLAKNPKTLGLIMQRAAPLLGQFLQGQRGSSSGGEGLGKEWNKYG